MSEALFTMQRRETGFYVGCLNLREQLRTRQAPLCFTEPLEPGTATLACRNLPVPSGARSAK